MSGIDNVITPTAAGRTQPAASTEPAADISRGRTPPLHPPDHLQALVGGASLVPSASVTIIRSSRQGLNPEELSPRKQAYLKCGSTGSRRITIETLGKVAAAKSSKNDIEIQVNGDGAAVRRVQAGWRDRHSIEDASPDEVLNAAKRLDGTLEPIFQEQLDSVARDVAPERHGVRDLRPLDSEDFKAAATGNRALRSVLMDEVTQAVGLSPDEAVDDIAAASARAVQDARAIGYIYTTRHPMDATGVVKGDGHSDAYILAPNGRALNLVPYPTVACEKVRDGLLEKGIPLASADLSRMIEPHRPVNLQADATSCNSLALSQMNQYQKDSAQQLKTFSLVISGLKEDGVGDFLLPSPQALFFSQATLPLKIADAMVREGGATAQIEHDGRYYTVRTLNGMMREGAKCEAAFGGPVHDLQAFRLRWCAELDKIQDKRDLLNYSRGAYVENGALAQATHRHAEFG